MQLFRTTQSLALVTRDDLAVTPRDDDGLKNDHGCISCHPHECELL